MKKSVIWLIAVIVIVIVIWGLLVKKPPALSPTNNVPIKMGVILPLSGDFAGIGEELKKGVDLAVDQLKTKGIKISVIYEDDMFDLKKVVTAASKLVNIDRVDLISLFTVTEARPVAPLLSEKKVPLVVLWDSNTFLKDLGPYVFSNGFSTEKAGEIMADFAFDKLGLKKVSAFSNMDSWSQMISESFQKQFKKRGGTIVSNDSVQMGTKDFRLMISKAKSQKADGIYAPLIPFDSVVFFKQVKEMGWNVPIMSGDALIQAAIDATNGAAENIYFTNAFSVNSELPNLYKTKYGKDSPGLVYVDAGFNGMMKIGRGVVGSKNIKEVLDRVFGPTRSADQVEKIYQVKNGIPVEVKIN